MGSRSSGLEGRVIILILLALALGAGFFALKKDREARASRVMAETHAQAAQDVRVENSQLGRKVTALELARRKAEDIAAAFDSAPRILPESVESIPTRTLKAGETFTADKPINLVDPERLAEAAASLLNDNKNATLLAKCQTVRDGFQEDARQERIRALKWKGRFPLGILAGAAVVGTVWIVTGVTRR
jgi:hypothetical protein